MAKVRVLTSYGFAIMTLAAFGLYPRMWSSRVDHDESREPMATTPETTPQSPSFFTVFEKTFDNVPSATVSKATFTMSTSPKATRWSPPNQAQGPPVDIVEKATLWLARLHVPKPFNASLNAVGPKESATTLLVHAGKTGEWAAHTKRAPKAGFI